MPPSAKEVCDAAQCDYSFVNNLISRGTLNTPLGVARSGVPRDYSRMNVLEIAFISAFVALGKTPTVAAAIAEELIAREARGKLSAWWIENTKSSEPPLTLGKDGAATYTIEKMAHEALLADKPGKASLVNQFDLAEREEPSGLLYGTCFAVIHLAEIVRRVDALFPQEK